MALDKTFYGQLDSLDGKRNKDYRVDIVQPQVEAIGKPEEIMHEFDLWLKKVSEKQPMFVSDNNGFDWQI